MGLVKEPVYLDDIQREFEGQFCQHEVFWISKKQRLCTAHLNEDHIFTCWCSSIENANEPVDPCAHHCEDAETI
jgi:hypothetical protein